MSFVSRSCGDGFATKDEALAFLKRVLPSLSEAQRAAAEEVRADWHACIQRGFQRGS